MDPVLSKRGLTAPQQPNSTPGAYPQTALMKPCAQTALMTPVLDQI